VEYLLLNIVRYVDDCQPGVVACEFRDSDGHLHTLIDKVPIFTSRLLEPDSPYPQIGSTQCEILQSFQDEGGRLLVRVKSIESTEGVSEFVVSAEHVSDDPNRWP
jgi:hypothetical protein